MDTEHGRRRFSEEIHTKFLGYWRPPLAIL
jgi:hypothetical protein